MLMRWSAGILIANVTYQNDGRRATVADMKQIHDFAVKWCDKFRKPFTKVVRLIFDGQGRRVICWGFEKVRKSSKRFERVQNGSKEFEKVRKSSKKFEKSLKIREIWGMVGVRKDSIYIKWFFSHSSLQWYVGVSGISFHLLLHLQRIRGGMPYVTKEENQKTIP